MNTKEFFSRWKEGIQATTQSQLLKINFIGISLVFTGIIFGLCVTAMSKTWWLFLILLGSFFLSFVNLVGMLKQYWHVKRYENILKGGTTNE